MREVNYRVEDCRRCHQRDRNGGGAVAQRGQQEHHENEESHDDPDEGPQPAPPGDRDDDDGEHRRHGDERPGSLVVVERVDGQPGLVDLAADPNVIADGEIRLARPATELEQRVGAPVLPGVDRHQRLNTLGVVALRGHRWGR